MFTLWLRLRLGKPVQGRLSSEPLNAGDANAAVVQVGAAAALGGEQFLPDGVVDDAGDQLAGALQAQRDVEHGEAVGEIGGAVQRVDIPAVLGRAFVPAAFFGHDGVRGEVRPQPLHHQFFRGAVGFRHQVELSLEFDGYAPFEVIRQKRAGLARDFHGLFQIGHGSVETLALFLEVLDVVLENEEVGLALAGQADEGPVVVFNRAYHFLPILHLHADGRGILNQALEIPDLFKRLFRRAAGFSTVFWSTHFFCRFFCPSGSMDVRAPGVPVPPSTSP